MDYIRTFTQFEWITKYKQVKSFCFAITFKVPATGNPVNINGAIIQAGDSLEIAQLPGMLDTTVYDVYFDPGVGSNELTIIKITPRDKPELGGF